MKKYFLLSVLLILFVSLACESSSSLPTVNVPLAIEQTLTAMPTPSQIPSLIPTETAIPTDLPITLTPTPTEVQSNFQETAQSTQDVDLILDVPGVLGKSVVEVENILGMTILVTPNDDNDDILAGGEYRDYMVGKYWIFLSFDTNGIARGFQVLDGLADENYFLNDWNKILPRFGLNVTVPPNEEAPAAIYWNNYEGLGVAIAASSTSGRPVWTVQIEDAQVFGR